MASRCRQQGLAALRAGTMHGYDGTGEALELARLASLLEQAAHTVTSMSEPDQQDYLHRMKAALILRDGAVNYQEETEIEP